MGYYKEDMRQETLSAEIKALEDQIAALGLKKVKSANEIESPTLRLRFDKLQMKIKDLKSRRKAGSVLVPAARANMRTLKLV